jgi:hypothetical protein
MYQNIVKDSIDFILASEYNRTGGTNWFADNSRKTPVINATNRQLNGEGQSDARY